MTKATETERRPRTTPTTIRLDVDLLEALRDTVVALSGPPVRLTVVGLVSEAVARELARLRKAHNHGKPFPRREAPPRLGRPVGR